MASNIPIIEIVDIPYLSEDELNYELNLRHITGTSIRRPLKEIKLKKLLENEEKAGKFPTSSEHVMNEKENFDIITKEISNLVALTTDALKNKDRFLIRTLKSRYNHYKSRLSLLNAENENYNYVYEIIASNIEQLNSFNDSAIRVCNTLTKTTVSRPINTSAFNINNENSQFNPNHNSTILDNILSVNPNEQISTPVLQAPNIQPNNENQELQNNPQNIRPVRNNISSQAVRDQILIDLLRRTRLNQNHVDSRIRSKPVHLWPMKFSGDPGSLPLIAFIKKIEMYAATDDEKDPVQLEYKILSGIKYLLSGSAEEWFLDNYDQICSWEDFKEKIKIAFLPTNYSHINRITASVRVQGENESFTQFYGHLRILFATVEPSLTEEEQLMILKTNLNKTYAVLGVNSQISLSELVRECRDLEARVSRTSANQFQMPMMPLFRFQNPFSQNNRIRPPINPFRQPRVQSNLINNAQRLQIPNQMSINAIDYPSETNSDLQAYNFDSQNYNTNIQNLNPIANNYSDPNEFYSEYKNCPQVNALQSGVQNSSNFANSRKCWQCQQTGHSWQSCTYPQTFLFCHGCGTKDTIRPNCQKCNLKQKTLSQQISTLTIQENSQTSQQ